MDFMPKVSVIIPVYNVEKYLAECLNSVLGQTLKEIEVICVNDGSTDRSLEILQQYREKDNRITIIDKSNAGYGHTMNCGLNKATGEYVAFLESDDYITDGAYEILYNEAENVQADIIKGNYVEVRGENGDYKYITKWIIEDKSKYGQIYDPEKNPWLFYVPMSNCLGLFRRDFIERHHVRHNETPGASHQDMGFWFQTFCLAKRIYFTDQAFYHYRQDNPNASMNDHKKIYAIHDEYMYIGKFLESHPDIYAWCAPVYFHRMYGSYLFRYVNMVSYLKPLFLYEVFRADFLKAKESDGYSEACFSPSEKNMIAQIVDAPEAFLASGKNQDALVDDLSKRLIASQAALREYQRRANTEMARGRCLQDPAEPDPDAPCVSVVIPVYNTAPYLEECLTSILSQTLKSIEVICVNDGSTDDSLQILDSFAQKDQRMMILSQPNMGQSAARNLGLSYAKGKYVYFMDSDDRLDVKALEYLYSEAEKESLDILCFDATVFFECKELAKAYKSFFKGAYARPREYGDVYSGVQLLNLFHKDKAYYVAPWILFIRREYLNESNVRFYEGIIYEDNLFTLQALVAAKRTSHRKKAFFTRRIRAGSTMTQEKTFRHLYGYLICYIQMVNMWIDYACYPDAAEEINIERKLVFNAVKRYYNQLDSNERSRAAELNKVEYAFLSHVISNADAGQKVVYRQGEDSASRLQVALLREEINRIYASKSFKVGRVITWIPRKIRGGIKCYKEHGLMYTLRRTWFHLTKRA